MHLINNFAIIFRHYFLRSCRDIVSLFVFGLLPLAIISVNYFIIYNIPDVPQIAGTTSITVFMLMAFQFFCGDTIIYHLNNDFRSTVRWRLYATPIPKNTFIYAAAIASWIYSITQGMLLILVSTLLFNVYWGNPLILVSVLLIISIMAQLVAILICLLTKTRKSASAILQLICFGLMALSGGLFGTLGDSNFLTRYGTPISLAHWAVLNAGPYADDMSKAILNIIILAAMTLVLAIFVLMLGRRRAI